jgi:hypothetical protein
MTSEAGREHKQDQRRLAATYNHAATAHDRAAQMHEKVAAHYDKHGKSARARRERWKAAQELQSAAADRKCVATLTAKVGGDLGSSSDESDKPGTVWRRPGSTARGDHCGAIDSHEQSRCLGAPFNNYRLVAPSRTAGLLLGTPPKGRAGLEMGKVLRWVRLVGGNGVRRGHHPRSGNPMGLVP